MILFMSSLWRLLERIDWRSACMSFLRRYLHSILASSYLWRWLTQLWRVLKQCHELHIRWISSTPYASIAPFVSRASPGLHVFFTPQRNRSAYVRMSLSLILRLLRYQYWVLKRSAMSFTPKSFRRPSEMRVTWGNIVYCNMLKSFTNQKV